MTADRFIKLLNVAIAQEVFFTSFNNDCSTQEVLLEKCIHRTKILSK